MLGEERCARCGNALAQDVSYCLHCGLKQSMFEESPLPSLAGHTGGSPAEQDPAPVNFAMDSMLADIAELPGVDPRGYLQGPLLPRGISKLRVVDILNLFLEGVVEQIEQPSDGKSEAATANNSASTSATPCTGLSLASSSGRSAMSRTSQRLHTADAAKTGTGKASSYAPPLAQTCSPLPKNARKGTPAASSSELSRLRAALQRQQALTAAQVAQCQEFKDMSEQSNSELVSVEGEARELRDEVARLSRQNKQLLLQLRQQRLKHQQELKLWQSRCGELSEVEAEEGGTASSLLSYLRGASEQQDSQLQHDLSAQSAETVQCMKSTLRNLLLEHFGQDGFTDTPPRPGHAEACVARHVKRLWTVLHQLWSADSLVEDAVEEMFHSSALLRRSPWSPKSEDCSWPEVATRAETQVTSFLEKMERLSARSGDRDGSESPVYRGPARSPPAKEPSTRSPDGGGAFESPGCCASPAGSPALVSASPVSPAEPSRRPAPSEGAPTQGQHRTQRTLPTRPAAGGEQRPTTPSFGSLLRSEERSLSPQASCGDAARTRVRPAPSVPAILAAGPVLQRAVPRARPASGVAEQAVKPRRQRSPDTSLSPRLPGKPPGSREEKTQARQSARPRSLSPEMSKRASWF